MLFHAVQAGLDMAIVNPAHITPYADIPQEERQLAEDLIYNRRPDALQRYIAHFDQVAGTQQAATQPGDPTLGMSPAERLHWRILHRHKDGVEADIDELLSLPSERSRHAQAVEILNTVLLPAMKEVGDKFGAGELILPFVLQSAEVMKKSVSYLEQFLEKKEGTTKGTVVLATVYGDVHDIGKNLVKTILANNGYTVVDLGKQVPAETIITKAIEVQADAIGLSALLVNTSKQMPLIINELYRRGLRFPVLLGGAAINRRFGWRIQAVEDGNLYPAGVFYCKDAFEGLTVMDALTDSQARPGLIQRIHREAELELGRTAPEITSRPVIARSSVKPQPLSPASFPLGPRLVRSMPLELVFLFLSKNELFRLSWGAKNTQGEEWEQLKAGFEKRLDQMQREVMHSHWLKPQAAYGYWPCQSDGDELILYAPTPEVLAQGANPSQEVARFTFPRQPEGDHLCLADYFAPLDSGKLDLVALQIVTVGEEATQRFDQLQAAGDYSGAYYVHGLAVQTAEACAEYLHRHIRHELNLPEGQGKRYSWGFPAIPELSDHRKVFNLLPVEQELGMSLTSAFQLVPEQSTAAIIVHHPEARYFSAAGSRIDQLMSAQSGQ